MMKHSSRMSVVCDAVLACLVCSVCVACGTERQDAVPSPSQTTAKAEDGTEFTGAYARRFADTYDNLQTGFARNLIKDGKISEKDIAALESKVMDCICAQAQSEDDFPTFDLTDGALTPVPYTGGERAEGQQGRKGMHGTLRRVQAQ